MPKLLVIGDYAAPPPHAYLLYCISFRIFFLVYPLGLPPHYKLFILLYNFPIVQFVMAIYKKKNAMTIYFSFFFFVTLSYLCFSVDRPAIFFSYSVGVKKSNGIREKKYSTRFETDQAILTELKKKKKNDFNFSKNYSLSNLRGEHLNFLRKLIGIFK